MNGLARWIAAWSAYFWIRSLRVKAPPLPENHKVLVALWHRDLPTMLAAYRGSGLGSLVSRSSDGAVAAMVMQRLGYRVVRGSGTHGFHAVRQLLQFLQGSPEDGSGPGTGMALDGPRGPDGIAHPGAAWLARKSGVTVWLLQRRPGNRVLRLPTWDHTEFPLPFSRLKIDVIPINAEHLATLRRDGSQQGIRTSETSAFS